MTHAPQFGDCATCGRRVGLYRVHSIDPAHSRKPWHLRPHNANRGERCEGSSVLPVEGTRGLNRFDVPRET